MNDLISRQSALDLAKDIIVPTKDGGVYRHRCIDPDEIRELPSAQPEVRTEMSSPKNSERTAESSQNVQNDDLISRKAAIDAISTWDKFGADERSRIVRWHEGLEPYVHLRDVVTAIVNLPSEHPELDEWCDTCKEYDQERHCCPRWNRVIKATLEEVDHIQSIINVTLDEDKVARVVEHRKKMQERKPEPPESAVEYCHDCIHAEMCSWYPEEGCEFVETSTYAEGYAEGYNDAKREIALSGEYERAYQRGFEDGRKSEWTAVADMRGEEE